MVDGDIGVGVLDVTYEDPTTSFATTAASTTRSAATTPASVAHVGSRRPDLPSLVAGIAIVIFGAVLLLDRADVLTCASPPSARSRARSLGAILLASGLVRRD